MKPERHHIGTDTLSTRESDIESTATSHIGKPLPSPTITATNTYTDFVREQADVNPSMSNLKRFLSSSNKHGCRIVALDFYQDSHVPTVRYISSIVELHGELQDETVGSNSIRLETVRSEVKDDPSPTPQIIGRLLLFEDLTQDVVETLGSTLDIDPLFFSSHIHAPWVDVGEQDTDISTLPSRMRPHEYVTIHHQRTLVYKDSEHPPKKLLRNSNVERKVIVLPPTRGMRIALAQHCMSVYRARNTNRGWLGLILVDSPLTDTYRPLDHGATMNLSLKPFGGGFGDFLSSPKMSESRSSLPGPRREGLLDSIVYYWQRRDQDHMDLKDPSVMLMAQYPLRIVASEWMIYYQVMRYSIKQYEYAPGLSSSRKLLPELEKLNDDLRGLQSWRRRALSSRHKIDAITRFLGSHSMSGKHSELCSSLQRDFEYVTSNIEKCGRLLEGMLPVVTSFVQIVDSRRSVAETANISRLTILALIFVPLTFVSSLFSMNSEFGPDGAQFWEYFAVAIPITLIVVLIALPPNKLMVRAFRRTRARLRGRINKEGTV